MIKKFRDYIKESVYDKDKDLFDEEFVEDNFLRLAESFGLGLDIKIKKDLCEVSISLKKNLFPSTDNLEYPNLIAELYKKIITEIKSIENRFKDVYGDSIEFSTEYSFSCIEIKIKLWSNKIIFNNKQEITNLFAHGYVDAVKYIFKNFEYKNDMSLAQISSLRNSFRCDFGRDLDFNFIKNYIENLKYTNGKSIFRAKVYKGSYGVWNTIEFQIYSEGNENPIKEST